MRRAAASYLQELIGNLSASAQASASSATDAQHTTSLARSIKVKLQNAINVMQEGLVERDTEVRSPPAQRCRRDARKKWGAQPRAGGRSHTQVRLLLLAAMGGEHILLIGPPGTAKSEIGRRLSKLVSGTYFERLLTRFSVPEVRRRGLIQGLTASGGDVLGPGMLEGRWSCGRRGCSGHTPCGVQRCRVAARAATWGWACRSGGLEGRHSSACPCRRAGAVWPAVHARAGGRQVRAPDARVPARGGGADMSGGGRCCTAGQALGWGGEQRATRLHATAAGAGRGLGAETG